MFFAKKLLFYQNLFPKTFTAVGTHSVVLVPGTYKFTLRGAGGGGGQGGYGANNALWGEGGAGGKGELKTYTVTITQATVATVYIGEGGKTYAAGGNGGAGGPHTDAPIDPGAGGGGGYPTFIKIGNTVYGALGGGGGGGAGGSDTSSTRYSDGGSGGGGGGFYRLSSNGTITSVPGQQGAIGVQIFS